MHTHTNLCNRAVSIPPTIFSFFSRFHTFTQVAEADGWAGGYNNDALAASIEFSALIQANDPYAHMIDNSFMGVSPLRGNNHVFETLNSTAFTSVHSYNMADVAACVWTSVTPHTSELGKPCFLEEFGTDVSCTPLLRGSVERAHKPTPHPRIPTHISRGTPLLNQPPPPPPPPPPIPTFTLVGGPVSA